MFFSRMGGRMGSGLSGTVPDVLTVLKQEAVDTSTLRPLEIRRMEVHGFMANGRRRTNTTALYNTPRAMRPSLDTPRPVIVDDRPLADRAHATRKCGSERHRLPDETKYPMFRRGNIQAFSIVGATNQGRCLPGSGMRSDMFRHVISTEGGRAQEEPRMAKGEGTPARLMDNSSVHHPESFQRGELTDPKRSVGAIEKAYIRRPKAMSSGAYDTQVRAA
ncbi:hypothetical protein EDB85DRAFT_1888934 [Lactarius pseudohatsudake]|nr:hypothetical protein EDB85DRAFT_1888934 [Lactarius pseudohatsudake]